MDDSPLVVKGKSLDVWRELGVELLLLCVERGQRFRLLIRIPTGGLPRGSRGSLDTLIWKVPDRPRTCFKGSTSHYGLRIPHKALEKVAVEQAM